MPMIFSLIFLRFQLILPPPLPLPRRRLSRHYAISATLITPPLIIDAATLPFYFLRAMLRCFAATRRDDAADAAVTPPRR